MVSRFQRILSDNLPPELVSRLPADMPNLRDVQASLNGLSQAEIAARLKVALSELDEQKVADFNQAISGFARSKGVRVPQANAVSPDMALVLAGMLRGGNGGILGLVAMLRDPRIAAVLLPFLRRLLKA